MDFSFQPSIELLPNGKTVVDYSIVNFEKNTLQFVYLLLVLYFCRRNALRWG